MRLSVRRLDRNRTLIPVTSAAIAMFIMRSVIGEAGIFGWPTRAPYRQPVTGHRLAR
jgi:hypothetical protein